MSSPGVASDTFCVCASFAGENHFGVVMHDEEILATDMVYHVGQVIAVVIASTRRYVHVYAFAYVYVHGAALVESICA